MLLKLQNRFFQLLKNFNISYKRYIFNEIDFSDKLIGIIGARGVGKTTLLLQYLKESSLPLTNITKKSSFSIDGDRFVKDLN